MDTSSGSRDLPIEVDRWEEKKKEKKTADALIYGVRISIILCVIITSIINLSLCTGNDSLWIALLSAAIGLLFPAPEYIIKR